MKKFLLISVMIILTAIGVYAAPGDTVGEIYSTDILAYINGSPINSYNIGGKTVILAEDLCNNDTGVHYGFDCVYDNTTRSLTLDSTFTEGNSNIQVERGSVGDVVGKVYETDIKVIFNSHEIAGYNIGGQTAICIEDLGAYDQSEHNAAYGYSKYLCNAVWNGETREIMLNTFLQDLNYFGVYPKRKLDFVINDNQIYCTFDQLGSYSGSVKFNYSAEFKNDIYRIKPVYFNDTVVGQVVMKPNGMAAFNMNDRSMYLKTKDLEQILTYEDSKLYIKENFEVITEKDDENATIYLAKKDDVHYLLFAMKNGGLVCDSKYDSSYSSVELLTDSEGIHFLKLSGQSFSGTMPVSTLGYDFTDSYDKYASFSVSDANRLNSRVATAVVEVDGDDCTVDAIYAYEYGNCVLVNINNMASLLGFNYKIHGGVFYLTITGEPHFVKHKTFDSDFAKVPDQLRTMSGAKVYINATESLFTYKDAVVLPYYYNGNIYVPVEFFENLYK